MHLSNDEIHRLDRASDPNPADYPYGGPASSSGLDGSPATSELFHLHGWQQRGDTDPKGGEP